MEGKQHYSLPTDANCTEDQQSERTCKTNDAPQIFKAIQNEQFGRLSGKLDEFTLGLKKTASSKLIGGSSQHSTPGSGRASRNSAHSKKRHPMIEHPEQPGHRSFLQDQQLHQSLINVQQHHNNNNLSQINTNEDEQSHSLIYFSENNQPLRLRNEAVLNNNNQADLSFLQYENQYNHILDNTDDLNLSHTLAATRAIELQAVNMQEYPDEAMPNNELQQNIARNQVNDLRQQLADIRKKQIEQEIFVKNIHQNIEDSSSQSEKSNYSDEPHYLSNPSQDLAHIILTGQANIPFNYQTQQLPETRITSSAPFQMARVAPISRTNDHIHSISQQSFNTMQNPIKTPSAKFNILKNTIEQSFSKMNSSTKSQQQKTLDFSARKMSLQQASLQFDGSHHYKSISNQQSTTIGGTMANVINASEESSNYMLKQQIKVMQLNEQKLQATIDSQQRKVEKERGKWEEQMIKMQSEVTQLNELITTLMSQKNSSLKCQCRPRIKDLERQVLNLHRELYFTKKGLVIVDQENQDPCGNSSVIDVSITPKILRSGKIIKKKRDKSATSVKKDETLARSKSRSAQKHKKSRSKSKRSRSTSEVAKKRIKTKKSEKNETIKDKRPSISISVKQQTDKNKLSENQKLLIKKRNTRRSRSKESKKAMLDSKVSVFK